MMDLIVFGLICYSVGFVSAIGVVILVFGAATRFVKSRFKPKKI